MNTTTHHAAAGAVLAQPCRRGAAPGLGSPLQLGVERLHGLELLIQIGRQLEPFCRLKSGLHSFKSCQRRGHLFQQGRQLFKRQHPRIKPARGVLPRLLWGTAGERGRKPGHDLSVHRAPVGSRGRLNAFLQIGRQSDLHLGVIAAHVSSLNHSGLCGLLHPANHRGLIGAINHRGLVTERNQ